MVEGDQCPGRRPLETNGRIAGTALRLSEVVPRTLDELVAMLCEGTTNSTSSHVCSLATLLTRASALG